MPFSAQAAANAFIDIAGKGALDPMKLQKLVYFAHGWHLAIENAPLVRQSFEAWQFGPVIPELYRSLREYGAGNVTAYARSWNFVTRRYAVFQITPDDGDDGVLALNVIADVWNVYGGYSATKLSNATHMPGTPWAKCYDPNKQNVVIPDSEIRTYFANIQARSGEALGSTTNP